MPQRFTYIGRERFPIPDPEPTIAPEPEPKRRGKKVKQADPAPATMEEEPMEPFSDEPA